MRALERAGWTALRQRGSHVIMEGPGNRGRVVVPAHGSRPVKPGILAAILKDADLSLERLREFL